MDDIGVDEKKPFDHDSIKDEDDSQPDPDETLLLDQGQGRVWSVKVCSKLTTVASLRSLAPDSKTHHAEMVRNK